jgi:hypothetical protein
VQYAQHLPSAHTHLASQRDALEIWGDISIQQLDRRKQLAFVQALRVRGLSDWTISTRLRRIWAMMNWCKRDNPQLVHRRPGFLKSVSEGIELLFTALSDKVARPFAGHERVDQRHPDDPDCAALLAKCLPTLQSGRTELCNCLNLERETRLRLPL